MDSQRLPEERPTFGLLVGRCLDSMGSVVEFGAGRVVDSIKTWKLENMQAQEPASLPLLPQVQRRVHEIHSHSPCFQPTASADGDAALRAPTKSELEQSLDRINKLEQERGKAADTIARLTSERDRVIVEKVAAVEKYGELLKVVDDSTSERVKLLGTVSNLEAARNQLSIQFDKLSRDCTGLAVQIDGLRLERDLLAERNSRLSQACEVHPARNFGQEVTIAINVILVVYALQHIVKYCRQVYKRRVHNTGPSRQTEPTRPCADPNQRSMNPATETQATDLDKFFTFVPTEISTSTSNTPHTEDIQLPSSPRTLDCSIRRFNSRLELVESVVSDTVMRVHEQGTVLQDRGQGLQLSLLESVVSDTAARVHRHEHDDATSSAATDPLFEADHLESEEDAEFFHEPLSF